MAKKKGGKKSKIRLDLDGLPSSAPIPSTKELILAHQIATAEKEIHDHLVDSKIFAEKIAVQNLQLNEAKAEQQRLIKRMKRQADAFRKFLKHGAKGKWKEGEVVNLGEGLRVMAKKPNVTKEDVGEARENAKEGKCKQEEEVDKLVEDDGKVNEMLDERRRIIEKRLRYRDEGAAADATAIAEFEDELVFGVENCQEMVGVARKVIDQSKQKIKDRADEEKQRAIDEAVSEMSRKRSKGIHRFVERENDWLRLTLNAYRSSACLLESQVTSLEEENLQLVDQIMRGKRKEVLFKESRYKVPDWRDALKGAAEGVGNDEGDVPRADSTYTMAMVLHPPRSSDDGVDKTQKTFPLFLNYDERDTNENDVEKEAERLLTRTPTLKGIALPLYREILAAKKDEGGDGSAKKSVKSLKPRVDTPEGVSKELNVSLSADASRPSTAARVPLSRQFRPSKRDAYLHEIMNHLFALDVRSEMEEEEERKRIESGVRIFGAKVRLHEILVKSLKDADATSRCSSGKGVGRFDTSSQANILPKNDSTFPHISAAAATTTTTDQSFESTLGSKASTLNRPPWTSIPTMGVERGAENLGRWPIDVVTMKKALHLPVLFPADDVGLD